MMESMPADELRAMARQMGQGDVEPEVLRQQMRAQGNLDPKMLRMAAQMAEHGPGSMRAPEQMAAMASVRVRCRSAVDRCILPGGMCVFYTQSMYACGDYAHGARLAMKEGSAVSQSAR